MMIRIGWIGCGTHASEMLLPQLVAPAMHGWRRSATSTPRGWRCTADRYGVTARYTDAMALLAHPGLDAIGMAVGPAQHAALGRAKRWRADCRCLSKSRPRRPRPTQQRSGRGGTPRRQALRGRLHETLLHCQPHRRQHPAGPARSALPSSCSANT